MGQMGCCFIGHRRILETAELREQIYSIVENMIVNEKVDTFLFGSKSQFNSLCYKIVTQLYIKYPYIKRIYVRAEFPEIDDSYRAYLLEHYEDTYYPEKILGAGKVVYVERNREMIDKSVFCVFYYQEKNAPQQYKSGTRLALQYAVKKNKKIYLLP